MLSCKQASVLVSRSLDKKLSWGERFNLRVHLMICDACSRFRLQAKQLHSSMKRMIQDTEQDAHLELSIKAKARINHAIESNRSTQL